MLGVLEIGFMKGWKRHEPGSGCFVATQELRAKSKQKKKNQKLAKRHDFPLRSENTQSTHHPWLAGAGLTCTWSSVVVWGVLLVVWIRWSWKPRTGGTVVKGAL